MSQPEVVAYMQAATRRLSSTAGATSSGATTARPPAPATATTRRCLGQDAGLREVIRGFLDKYPGCAFQAVNGGGNNAGYDYARYASTVSFSDGAVGIIRNYYASLLLPPDKTSDIPDVWNPDQVRQGHLARPAVHQLRHDRRHLGPGQARRAPRADRHLPLPAASRAWWAAGCGSTGPLVAGDDPTMYFQRLSGDRRRGIIIPKRPAPGPVTIKPKGLLPAEKLHGLVPGIGGQRGADRAPT